jgi:hypothetical protein
VEIAGSQTEASAGKKFMRSYLKNKLWVVTHSCVTSYLRSRCWWREEHGLRLVRQNGETLCEKQTEDWGHGSSERKPQNSTPSTAKTKQNKSYFPYSLGNP